MIVVLSVAWGEMGRTECLCCEQVNGEEGRRKLQLVVNEESMSIRRSQGEGVDEDVMARNLVVLKNNAK